MKKRAHDGGPVPGVRTPCVSPFCQQAENTEVDVCGKCQVRRMHQICSAGFLQRALGELEAVTTLVMVTLNVGADIIETSEYVLCPVRSVRS